MLRKLVLAAVGATLALGILAVPASAAPEPARALEINAIPGTAIDICAGGKEYLSNFRYGKSARRDTIVPGPTTWKIKKAAPGKCTGKRLATFSFDFAEGATYTIVYSMPKSVVKMRIYQNKPVALAADEAAVKVVHAAKANAIDVWLWQAVPAPAAIKLGPTVDTLRKGNVSKDIVVKERYTVASVFPTAVSRKWSSESTARNLDAGWGYQLVFMGDTRKNMRLKFYRWPDF